MILLSNQTRISVPALQSGTLLTSTQPLPPFSLNTTNLDQFSNKSLDKQWTFMFFGYTSCPDICPITLSIMNQVNRNLKDKNLSDDDIDNIKFVFVSVDPERDTAEKLKQYTEYFNPAFIGVTGDHKQLDILTKTVGVPYYSFDSKDNSGDFYLVDHGASIVLFNPYGQLQAIFTAPHTPEQMTDDFLSIQSYFDTIS